MVLEVRGATVHDRDGRVLLDDLSITVRRGEIVGLAGVEGNGQRALADVLSSLVSLDRRRGARRSGRASSPTSRAPSVPPASA